MLSTKDLIRTIQQKPALWNRHSFEYKDRLAKDKAWLEIYREIEPSYDSWKPALQQQFGASITKKWYNIRDSYAKSRRSGASKRCRPYIYADMLSFLDPIYHLEDKDDNSFKIDETPESEHFETEACYFEIDENDDAKRPKFDTDGSKRDEDIVAVLANLIQREEDEDRSFLKSLTPAVKSLSETSKLEFKIGVLSLLKKLKQKDAPVQIKIESMTKNSDSE